MAEGSSTTTPSRDAATVGLLEGLASTRAIRRYRDEPVPDDVLREICFAATRAPSGSNRQPFRFIVLRDGPTAHEAKRLIGESARASWGAKRTADRYDEGSGVVEASPKARLARTMQHYVDHFEDAPVLVLACLARYRDPSPEEGASVYPACQNMLLAARALGYGGVLTGFQRAVLPELRALLGIPDHVALSGAITLGRPVGGHGPVRRQPMRELIYENRWEEPAAWAIDPEGTRYAQGGPPKDAVPT
jgi:nitroreductase